MMSKNIMYLVSFILCFLISFHVGNSELLATACNQTTAGYNITSPTGTLFLQNMVSLFTVLHSNASQPSGFYNYTVGGGTGGPVINGLFLCRGDVSATDCQICLNSAISELLQTCPNVTRAITWYDDCMLRFSDLPIFSKMETTGGWFVWETNNVTDGALLNRTLGVVFNDLTIKAAYGSDFPGKKFSVGSANFTGFTKIFAMNQCTPDLTNLECETCLRDAITDLPRCCTNRLGGYVLHPSCNIRYSTTPFSNSVISSPALPPPPPQRTPPIPLTPPPPPPPSGLVIGGSSMGTIAAIASPIPTAAGAFLVALYIVAV